MFGPGDGIIRVGDSSSHGGTVVTGQANYLVDGIPVAVVGDMVACPQKGHGVYPIVEGHPTFSVNGSASHQQNTRQNHRTENTENFKHILFYWIVTGERLRRKSQENL